MNTRETFGVQIQRMRKHKRLTQEELAVAAGVTRKNINMIENGKYSPGLDVLIRISDALEGDLIIAPKV